MNKVNALCGCSVFGAMSFTVIAATASSSGLRYGRHRAAMMSLLQFLVAQSCMSCHGIQMLATSLRVRIAEPDTMQHVRMQVLFAYSGACGSMNLAVLYGCQCALLLCSLGGAGKLSGTKLSIFFSHRHRSIHHISLWSAGSKAIKSIATGRKVWSKVNSLLT